MLWGNVLSSTSPPQQGWRQLQEESRTACSLTCSNPEPTFPSYSQFQLLLPSLLPAHTALPSPEAQGPWLPRGWNFGQTLIFPCNFLGGNPVPQGGCLGTSQPQGALPTAGWSRWQCHHSPFLAPRCTSATSASLGDRRCCSCSCSPRHGPALDTAPCTPGLRHSPAAAEAGTAKDRLEMSQ